MAYDTPQIETYNFPVASFGGAQDSQRARGPKGKKGLVRDIQVDPTADFVGTTTVPEIRVGASLGSNEYARLRLGSAAGTGNTVAQGTIRASSLASSAQGNSGGSPPALNDYAGHVALETAYIPADTDFFMTRMAGVGGTPAGGGRTHVTIHWF